MDKACVNSGEPRLYPLFVRLEGRSCLVVGAGKIACRKTRELLECGATVTVVGPEPHPDFAALECAFSGRIEQRREGYSARELSTFALVIAATDSPEINALVAQDAERARVWCNVVDVPVLCTVQNAAILRRGPVQVAVNTGGVCPALSAILRDELEAVLPESLAAFARALGRVREWLLAQDIGAVKRKAILRELSRKSLREAHSKQGAEPVFETLLAEARIRLAEPGEKETG